MELPAEVGAAPLERGRLGPLGRRWGVLAPTEVLHRDPKAVEESAELAHLGGEGVEGSAARRRRLTLRELVGQVLVLREGGRVAGVLGQLVDDVEQEPPAAPRPQLREVEPALEQVVLDGRPVPTDQVGEASPSPTEGLG